VITGIHHSGTKLPRSGLLFRSQTVTLTRAHCADQRDGDQSNGERSVGFSDGMLRVCPCYPTSIL
jgi:hypothetical protein